MPHGQVLHNELCGLFAKAKMPTSPALALELLRLASLDTSGVADFAALIRTDAALAGRLLKMANTTRFAQRTPVTTIERAVAVLGLERVRTAALGFQLVSHVDRLDNVPFDLQTFWQHALLRASLARSLAGKTLPKRAGEAFLIGLLQDCGILLLAQILGASYAALYRSALSPSAFHEVECASFPYTHVDAIAAMASEWQLPSILSLPLKRHHRPPRASAPQSETDHLSAVAHFVGSLCFVGDLKLGTDDQQLHGLRVATLGADESRWDEVQDRARQEYAMLAGLFGDILPPEVSVADLLSEANRQLLAAAEEREQRIVDVQAEREALRREQDRLEGALREYRDRAALDPLTNVLNRGAIMDAARELIASSIDRGVAVGVLFLDIDDFKRLNDTHGHRAGDLVLKWVAKLLGEDPAQNVSIGRYGGDEFVLLLRGPTADRTSRLGQRVLEHIRHHAWTEPDGWGPITCSVGAIWTDRVPFKSAEELLAAADRVMYEAKRSGKDRCCFKALPTHSSKTKAEGSASAPEAGTPPPENADAIAAATRPEEMVALARRLNDTEVDAFVGIRKQKRTKYVTRCTVRYSASSTNQPGLEEAVTRDISTGGVRLLLRRPMVRGEALEVILPQRGSKLVVAGLVAFCRHIGLEVHEVGIQFVPHSVKPSMHANACQAEVKASNQVNA